MHPELARHDRERRAFLVPCRREGDRFVGHLANYPPTSDARVVEMVDHRRSVNLISAGEHVDRIAISIETDECIDVGRRQSSLDRV